MMRDIVLKHVLKNELDYGKASAKAVMSKVLGEDPNLRKHAKDVLDEVGLAIKDISSWSEAEKRKKLLAMWPGAFEQKVREQTMPELPNVGKSVVMMFPPEPSKYPHIGHAKASLLNHEYARRYGGKFILRFEDSNPAKVEEKYYGIQQEDYAWLGMKWDSVDCISSHMGEIYKIVERLIGEGKAYVCCCSQEETKGNRAKSSCCACRESDGKAAWKGMLLGGHRGSVVRMKADMAHKNAAMRDPTIMRHVDGAHPRTGAEYRVWPVYEFATSIMDGMEGITHRIRSKEFETKDEVQAFMREACGFKSPTVISIGRLNLEGVEAAGRRNRELVESGKYIGWDDPRLPTLRSFKRRGFVPAAIKEFVLQSGLSKADSTVPMSVLESINKRHIDKGSNRIFFVPEPKKISVKGIPTSNVELKNHPELPEKGSRKYILDGDMAFYVPERLDDFRLKDAFNVRKGAYGGTEIRGNRKLQWVEESNAVECELLMPDATVVKGVIERAALKLKQGQHLQLERVGYAVVDKIEGSCAKLWFTHA